MLDLTRERDEGGLGFGGRQERGCHSRLGARQSTCASHLIISTHRPCLCTGNHTLPEPGLVRRLAPRYGRVDKCSENGSQQGILWGEFCLILFIIHFSFSFFVYLDNKYCCKHHLLFFPTYNFSAASVHYLKFMVCVVTVRVTKKDFCHSIQLSSRFLPTP